MPDMHRPLATAFVLSALFSGVALNPQLANMLYVNALAYGLVQPSALGGRYLQRAAPQP
jgi:hypothetical protein